MLPCVRTLVLPKVHVQKTLTDVADTLSTLPIPRTHPLNLVASIESAQAMFNLRSIGPWHHSKYEAPSARLSALLVRLGVNRQLS